MLHLLMRDWRDVGTVGAGSALAVSLARRLRRLAVRGVLRAAACGPARAVFWLAVMAGALWAADKAVQLWVITLSREAHRYIIGHWPGG